MCGYQHLYTTPVVDDPGAQSEISERLQRVTFGDFRRDLTCDIRGVKFKGISWRAGPCSPNDWDCEIKDPRYSGTEGLCVSCHDGLSPFFQNLWRAVEKRRGGAAFSLKYAFERYPVWIAIDRASDEADRARRERSAAPIQASQTCRKRGKRSLSPVGRVV